MERTRFTLLTTFLAAFAAGDASRLDEFLREFGGPLRGVVVRHLRALHVTPSADLVDEAVLDVALRLVDLAPRWDPRFGVPPWTWAERAIRVEVARLVGQHADSLDDDRRPEGFGEDRGRDPVEGSPASAAEADPRVLLERAAAGDPAVGLFREALEQVCPRADDRLLILEYAIQQGLADPAPASTLAEQFGLAPATIRQRISRAKRRLRALAAAESRFALLADLWFLR